MLKVEMTPNLLGFKIGGTYGDLDELYDAIWVLTIADDDFPDDKRMRGMQDEQMMSVRLLALNSDIRHAYQGSRNIELEDSGMHEWDAEYRELPLAEKNVVFSVEVLYPEAMFEALALNYLLAKRASRLDGKKTMHAFDGWPGHALLDGPSSIVRMYLGKLLGAVEKEATPGRYARIRKALSDDYYMISSLYSQWIDIINADYVQMTRKQRAEGLSTVVRDLVEFWRNPEYLDLTADVDAAAKRYGTTRDDIMIPNICDWEMPEW